MRVEIYGVWEVADFFGVTKQALFHWRKNDPLFPEPEAELRSGPVWTRPQLELYRDQRLGSVGRLSLQDVRATLELCARQFAFYADQHERKAQSETLGPEKIAETLDKAKVNREMVARIEAVLRGEKPTEGSEIAP